MSMTGTNGLIKVFAVFVACAFISLLVATDSQGQMAASPGGTTGATVVEEKVEQSLPAPGNVTVNFKDVDIRTVLHYLSEVSGVDIIPAPGVDDKVTVRLRNKPWEVALDIVTRNYGYVYSSDEERGIIRVMPKSQLRTEEPITDVIPLNYVIQGSEGLDQNISKLLDAIDSVIVKKAGEKATFLPSVNAIVVTAIPARVSIIKDMIAKIDKRTPQIMLEAKVIEVTLDRNDQFGIDWTAVISAAGAERPMTFPFQSDGTLPFLPSELQEKYYPSNNVSDGDTDFPYLDTVTTISPLATGADATALFTYGTLDFSSFQAVLRLIDERDDTNILSSPRITTLNNQPAVIKVITNVYLQKQTKSTDTANIVTVEFETDPREVGVVLEVTPHVNDNGEITVNLKPSVSSNLNFSEISVSGALNTVAMTYNSREADTQVMVKDGETIFIGGLITETVEKEDHKFPILGDLLGGIPVVGGIFKYEQDNVDKTEIVFFVTVHLLKDGPHSINVSQTRSQYEKYYASSEEEKAKKNEPRASVIKTGRLEVSQEQVEINVTSPQAEGEEKTYKPFLDFRKKK